MYGAGFGLLRFLLFFFNRLAVFIEQLASAFRRLAGDVFHRHALARRHSPFFWTMPVIYCEQST